MPNASRVAIRQVTGTTELAAVERLQAAVFTPSDRVPVTGRVWWLGWDGSKPVAFAGLRLVEDAAFLCLSGVLRTHRGRGLQVHLIQTRERFARRTGATACITYTVPDNPASGNSLIRAGFRLYEPQFAWCGRGVLYWQKTM